MDIKQYKKVQQHKMAVKKLKGKAKKTKPINKFSSELKKPMGEF